MKYFGLAVSMFVIFFSTGLYAEETGRNSYSEFPVIVFVGQVVEITPFSVVFENTYAETGATDEKVKQLIDAYSSSLDYRDHGFANALKVISVKDGKMRVALYLDNITKVFHDDVRTYMKFIPLYYVFRNNIKELKVSPQLMEELRKHALDYYLNLPMAKELMSNAWLAGVFQIHPETGKLVYHASNFYQTIDEMKTDDFAAEYRIFDIVKAGMTMTVSKARVIGNENFIPDPENSKKEKSGLNDKKQFNNNKTDKSGQGK